MCIDVYYTLYMYTTPLVFVAVLDGSLSLMYVFFAVAILVLLMYSVVVVDDWFTSVHSQYTQNLPLPTPWKRWLSNINSSSSRPLVMMTMLLHKAWVAYRDAYGCEPRIAVAEGFVCVWLSTFVFGHCATLFSLSMHCALCCYKQAWESGSFIAACPRKLDVRYLSNTYSALLLVHDVHCMGSMLCQP